MNAKEIINSAMDIAQKEADKYTYPVYISDLMQKPDLIATSVILEIKQKFYLITAAHALHSVLSSKSQFIIGVKGNYVSLEGTFTSSNSEKIDHFDIAYIELKSEFITSNKIKALREEKLVIKPKNVVPHISFIHGYPNSMNKQSKALYNTKSFRVKAYAYGGAIKNDFPHWLECEKNRGVHTCMSYGITSENNTPRHPRGISGGGLWVISQYSDPNSWLLDSILIEYHKKYGVVFSTKVSEIVKFINATKN